ncbi:TetR/AcrR family transcriptional regulator C-terminal domain-containing protein [Promicromonospora sp. NPDC023987]|uniref:TetR/AcrR family transcriptional regulator C-terminal domain-containing protein n=1 Tax=Promicromonospora sp. NPDC023987 TaxID=3155360 RepID=UPI0033FE34CC
MTCSPKLHDCRPCCWRHGTRQGPQRAQATLAWRLRALADEGLLACDDAELAADHFLLLTQGAVDARSDRGANPLDDAEAARIITAGVRHFPASRQSLTPRARHGRACPSITSTVVPQVGSKAKLRSS